ncbi:NYN domain-containing protein [Hygrophoropsis aurantiaca]|uniref:NYN domain-containing protein n=1 Tax=Hygrophoropsis aurantiaca TaxID=72124 RepID=A0ACB8AS40_9AGAM|nr:NYN domain-containing protein [Hygrophoropsis aurantiaca]
MSETQDVAIFWDYENCSPPSSLLGYDIVNNIRRMAHVFGSVNTFKAYLGLSDQSVKSTSLRSELQSSGVSLIDCPHNGRKDVADKMILVDMLTFAIDHPAPATIVLITGDRDYAYAVSTLRLRRYRVVLIVPPAVHSSLQAQASIIVDWSFGILGRRIDQTTSPVRQPRTLSGGVPASYEKPLGGITSAVPGSPTIPNHFKPCTTSAHSTQTEDNDGTAVNAPDIARIMKALGLDDDYGGESEDESSINFMEGNKLSSESFVGKQDASRRRFELDYPPDGIPMNTLNSAKTSRISSNSSPCGMPSISTLSASKELPSTSIKPTTPIPFWREAQALPVPVQATAPPNNPPPTGLAMELAPSHFQELINQLLLAREKGVLRPLRMHIAIDLVKADKTVYKRAGVAKFGQFVGLAEKLGLVQLGGYEADAWIALHPDWFKTDSNEENDPPQWPVELTSGTCSFKHVPVHFQPVAKCLTQLRNKGVQRPLRSSVGLMLGPAVYARAGVKTFKDYLALAEQASIVQRGGRDGHAWVSLHASLLP